MHQSRGAIFVAVLTTALVALAIVYPQTGQRDGPIVTEAPDQLADQATGVFSSQQKN